MQNLSPFFPIHGTYNLSESGARWDKSNNKHAIKTNVNKGNAKRGVSPRLKIRPCDLDL